MPRTYPYLIVDGSRDVATNFFIVWQYEDDIGGTVGDAEHVESDLISCAPEDWNAIAAALAAAKTPGVARDHYNGYFWPTRKLANGALRAINTAIKAGRNAKPWPEWAIKATAEGWKPPKNWTP